MTHLNELEDYQQRIAEQLSTVPPSDQAERAALTGKLDLIKELITTAKER